MYRTRTFKHADRAVDTFHAYYALPLFVCSCLAALLVILWPAKPTNYNLEAYNTLTGEVVIMDHNQSVYDCLEQLPKLRSLWGSNIRFTCARQSGAASNQGS